MGHRNESDTSVRSRTVRWYRTPINRHVLADLNTKSDMKGFLQTLGYLSILAATGGSAFYGFGHWSWWITAALVFLHGTVASFAINGLHELVHKSVFETQWLNDSFVRIFALISWVNFPFFYASHMRHHQFTLHPPDDLEVVLPIRLMVRHFFRTGFVNGKGMYDVVRTTVRYSLGRFAGDWELALFPNDDVERSRPVVRWARTHLAVHASILLLSLYYGWWLVPLLTTFVPLYGGWLFFLCNNTQHIGLLDNVPDFRLCCRTFTVNPLLGFLYWHMNYHIEHHMYAAVPCYNLARLHRAILRDLPPCPHGIRATWEEIAAIQKKQETDPGYQYIAALPRY